MKDCLILCPLQTSITFQHLKWEKAEKILVFIKLMFEVIMKNENRNDLISLKGIFKLDLLYLFVSCLYGHHMTDWYP